MKILYAWEIGEDLGHIHRFRPIAQRLQQRGHDVSFALCDLSRGYVLRQSKDQRIYQAPCHTRNRTPQKNNKTYPQTLLNHGFGDEHAIAERFAAWRTLLDHEQPQMVVCDLAPTAQWCAQSLQIPTVLFGDGFDCPPAVAPMPPFIGVDPHSIQELHRDELLVNQAIQRVCQRESIPVSDLRSILERAHQTLLTTYPELDPYGVRDLKSYVGSWTSSAVPPNAQTKESFADSGEPPEVFCYLKFQPGIDFVIGTLVGMQLRSHIYVAGAPSEFFDCFLSPNLRFLKEPADLRALTSTLKVAVTHGNHGTTSYFLSQGIPVVMLPMHVEQWGHALRAQLSNLGRISDLSKPALFPNVLRQTLEDESIRASLQEFAARAKSYPEPVDRITDALLGTGHGA